MENIFYAALALHIGGKPVNRENINAILQAARTPVNEPALDAMAAFVESLDAARRERGRAVDPRIVKFLSTVLAQRKVETRQLEALLDELTRVEPALVEQAPVVSERVHRKEDAEGDARTTAEVSPVGGSGAASLRQGRYVYGVATGGEEVRLGAIGIDGSEVYCIPYQDVSAIVHDCPAEPYRSTDDETVKRWVGAHQRVLDEAGKRFGTVIPSSFDVILEAKDDSTSPDEVVRNWLQKDYDGLRAAMERIRGRDEYGVQISYDPKAIGEAIVQQSDEIRKLREEMATKSPGMAYMYRQKLEKAVKVELDRLAEERFKDFYGRIRQHTDDIVVEKTKKVDRDRVMLLNLSCLVAREEVKSLAEELEKINNTDDCSVRFTGPWPPYSFVAKPTE
jgi:hypothetical protein